MATYLGNGGVNYNTADAEMKKKIAQNQLKLKNDPNYVQSEVDRTLQVINNRQAQGLDVTDQNNYLTKNLGYTTPVVSGKVTSQVTPKTTTTQSATTTPKTNVQQSTELMDMMRQIATRETTPFSYDMNSDPAYQAALQRAKANAQTASGNAMAELNRRGILDSTITSDRLGQIEQAEYGRVSDTVLPQLMQQAYQRYLDEQSMDQQKFANMGSLAGMYQGEDQRGIDNENTRAQLTGYLPGGEQAQQLVNQLLGLKEQAETKGITAAERKKLSNQADGIRAMLSQMGVDASKYGANVNYNTASQVTPMIRTLAGQSQDLAAQSQTFNQNLATRQQDTSEKQYAEQFAYQKARDAIADQQYKMQFDEDTRQFGLQYALNRQVQLGNLNLDQARLALSQDDNARQWAALDWEMTNAGTGSTASYSGMTPNAVYEAVRSQFYDSTTKKIPSDSTTKESIYMQVGTSGLPEAEADQVMIMLGLTSKEIANFNKKHGVTSGK